MKYIPGRICLVAAGMVGCLLGNAQLLYEGFEHAALGSVDTEHHVTGWEIGKLDGVGAGFSIVDDPVNSGSRSLSIEVGTISGSNPGVRARGQCTGDIILCQSK